MPGSTVNTMPGSSTRPPVKPSRSAARQSARAKELGERKLVAPADAETAQANADAAQATVEAAESALEQSRAALQM